MHFGIAFAHVPSTDSPGTEFGSRRHALYVISDYPAGRFRPGQMEHIAACVREGSGLAMLGGWESFHGRLGEYHRAPLAEVLPVAMEESDDRRNAAQPCLIRRLKDHPILDGLPWDTPPGIGGYNAVSAKRGAEKLLSSVRFEVHCTGDDFQFFPGEEAPLLVVGGYGDGRTTALATDVAPHWVGGWVDWGTPRIAQPIGNGVVEFGCHYARFFRNLLVWTGRLEEQQRYGA